MSESFPSGSPSLAARLDPRDPLSELDRAFHEVYAIERDATAVTMGPKLAQIEDSLILHLGGRRLEGPARTRLYHELKAVSHVPITLYLLLARRGVALDPATYERLALLARGLETAAASMHQRSVIGEVLQRQHRILQRCLELANRATAESCIAPAELEGFVRAITPDLIDNMRDAARDQICTMHRTLTTWLATMSPQECRDLQAVVAVSHMSRPGNIGVQYLSVALGEQWKGRFNEEDLTADRRVLASEVTTDEPAALTLLATHELDTRIAQGFFHQQDRMGRDLLADATERLLSEMFGLEPDVAG